MAINSGMYNRPMTEEEERMMMAQSLKGMQQLPTEQLPTDSAAPMAPSMTIEEIDEQMRQLQMLKNQMYDPNRDTGGIPYMDEINRRALIGTDYTVEDPMINSYQDNFNNSMALQEFYDEDERRRIDNYLDDRRFRTIDPYLGR